MVWVRLVEGVLRGGLLVKEVRVEVRVVWRAVV